MDDPQLKGAEALALLDGLFARAPAGLGYADRSLRMVRMNDALAALGGATSPTRGESLREALPDLADVLEPLHRHVLARRQGIAEAAIALPGRGGDPERTFLCTVYPVLGRRGTVAGVGSIVIENIRARNASEPGASVSSRDAGALRPGEQVEIPGDTRFRALCDSTQLGICLANACGESVYANPAQLEMLGLSPEESLGAGWLRAIHPEDRDRIRAEWDAHTASSESYRTSGRIHRGDGRVRWFESSCAPVREDGRLLGFAIVTQDATETRLRDDALRESEERFRQLAQGVDAVFWLAEPGSLRRVYVSPAYERIWGRSLQALLDDGSLLLESIHPEDRERMAQIFLERGGAGYDEEYRIVRPDGTTARIRDRASPVRDERGRVRRIAGIAFDVTELRQMEEQLRYSQKMETVGRLAGAIAHDFNNLLTVILAHVDFAKRGLVEGSEVAPDLQEIELQSRRAVGLTRQLLAFSQRQVVEPSLVDLNALVLQLDRLMRRLIGEDVELVTTLTPSLGSVQADRGQLEQVLLNLLMNAREAMPGGGKITISTADLPHGGDAALPSAGRGRPWVRLSVEDTGTGMSAEAMEHLFEPFYSTRGGPHGTGAGLGLATCHGIVQQSGGHIHVSNGSVQGARFDVFLPRVAEPAAVRAEPAMHTPTAGRETLLVVEDEPSVRSICVRALRRDGYRVLEAANGMEALQRAGDFGDPIHLLVTDLVMPVLGGRMLAERLCVLRPALRVLFMSGYADGPDLAMSLRDGSVAFLQKPFLPADLARRVRELLDARGSAARMETTAH